MGTTRTRTAPAPPATGSPVWLDGRLVAWEEANVHVLSHALGHGTGVFEGIRCYDGVGGRALFRLSEHVERLFRSARVMLMPMEHTPAEVRDAIVAVVANSGYDESYVRVIAFRELGALGIDARRSRVQLAVAAWSQPPSFSSEVRAAGLRVTIASLRRHDPNAIPVAKITGGYVTSVLARQEAVLDGYDEAILLSSEGRVSEASIQNVFVVRDRRIVTPPLSDGPLPGITRATVIELAHEHGLSVSEASILRSDLYAADEVFLTGTGAEVAPVREVDGRELGRPGPVYRDLAHQYALATRGMLPEHADWLHAVDGAR